MPNWRFDSTVGIQMSTLLGNRGFILSCTSNTLSPKSSGIRILVPNFKKLAATIPSRTYDPSAVMKGDPSVCQGKEEYAVIVTYLTLFGGTSLAALSSPSSLSGTTIPKGSLSSAMDCPVSQSATPGKISRFSAAWTRTLVNNNTAISTTTVLRCLGDKLKVLVSIPIFGTISQGSVGKSAAKPQIITFLA